MSIRSSLWTLFNLWIWKLSRDNHNLIPPRFFQQVTARIRPLFRQRVLGERLKEEWRFSSYFSFLLQYFWQRARMLLTVIFSYSRSSRILPFAVTPWLRTPPSSVTMLWRLRCRAIRCVYHSGSWHPTVIPPTILDSLEFVRIRAVLGWAKFRWDSTKRQCVPQRKLILLLLQLVSSDWHVLPVTTGGAHIFIYMV